MVVRPLLWDADEGALAEFGAPGGFDDVRAHQGIRLAKPDPAYSSRSHPAPERVLGRKVQTTAVLELLSRFGGPAELAEAGKREATAVARKERTRAGQPIAHASRTDLAERPASCPEPQAPRPAYRACGKP